MEEQLQKFNGFALLYSGGMEKAKRIEKGPDLQR